MSTRAEAEQPRDDDLLEHITGALMFNALAERYAAGQPIPDVSVHEGLSAINEAAKDPALQEAVRNLLLRVTPTAGDLIQAGLNRAGWRAAVDRLIRPSDS